MLCINKRFCICSDLYANLSLTQKSNTFLHRTGTVQPNRVLLTSLTTNQTANDQPTDDPRLWNQKISTVLKMSKINRLFLNVNKFMQNRAFVTTKFTWANKFTSV